MPILGLGNNKLVATHLTQLVTRPQLNKRTHLIWVTQPKHWMHWPFASGEHPLGTSLTTREFDCHGASVRRGSWKLNVNSLLQPHI